MNTPFYIISAFTNSSLHCEGNPCAVILLQEQLDETRLQHIARTLNYPATSFIFKNTSQEFEVSWFAPDAEIQLCGHGAYASFGFLYETNPMYKTIALKTKDGKTIKSIIKDGDIFMTMENIDHQHSSKPPKGLSEALRSKIVEYYITSNKHIVVLEDQDSVSAMQPDFNALRKIDTFGYSVTATGNDSAIDFVSRTIIPHVQQLEDHATGSSHAALFPFWKNRLNKSHLSALQLSPKGGYFEGQFNNGQVTINSGLEIHIKGSLDL